MLKSDLLDIFLSLNEAELRDAKKFLRSPYFNKREDVILLFDFMLAQKNKSKPNFSREAAYQAIFEKKPFDDVAMRYTMSYLLQLLYRFMSLQSWENDPIAQDLHLYKTLINKDLGKQSERKSKEVLLQIEAQPFRDKQYHFQKYQWLTEKYEFAIKHRRTEDLHLEEMTQQFTKYYLAEALRQSCALLSLQNMTAQHYDLSFSDELIRFVEKQNYQQIPAIAVYYHSYLSLQNAEQSEHFFQLKTILTEHWHTFPQAEIKDIYRLAINYCIKKQNKGDALFIREGFDLYKNGIENGILLENNVLSVFTYNNVHLLADKLGEFDWIVHFLEKYKDFLPDEQREHHYQFNLAQFYFRRKQYQNAMPLLQTLDFTDVLHHLDARKMLLVMYFDLGEFKALDALIDSFTSYLQRRKEMSYHKESFSNLLKYTKKLLTFPSLSQKEKNALKKEIEACETLAEKAWLLGHF